MIFLPLEKRLIFTLVIFVFGLFFSSSLADKLILKDGTSLVCVVIQEEHKSVLVETETGTITFPRPAIGSIEKEAAEINFIHRGDFFVKKGKWEEALSQYGQALALNPTSTVAKGKYRELREKIESIYIQELWTRGKKSEETHALTAEDYEAIKARGKTKKREKLITLTVTGSAKFPEDVANERKARKMALSLAKADALKSAFGEAVGVGFIIKGRKVRLLPAGELPNCKMKIISKGKTDTSYLVKVQLELAVSSFLMKIPEGLETYTVEGRGATKQSALENAYRSAILKALENQPVQKKKWSGRLFEVGLREESEEQGTFYIRTDAKVWFTP